MELSLFGEKITARSGILDLMDDRAPALQGKEKKYMLGGGNPAVIPEVSAVVNLASGGVGQLLVEPLIRSGEVLKISEEYIRPFYRERSKNTVRWIRQAFPGNLDYAVHKSQGAIFLWIWFKNLSVSTKELYERLKKRNVIVVPGEYFFFGLEEDWAHSRQCIRLSYSSAEEDIRRGIEIIAEETAELV
jgi:valine--pyruvate aminotransferase